MSKKDREETKKKIEKVMKAKGEELEKAADEIAPGFDYETAAEEIEAEEAAEPAEESSDAEPAPLPPAEVSKSKYPKPRKEYKTAIGRAFLSDNNGRVLGATIVLLVFVLIWSAVYWMPLAEKEAAEELISLGQHTQMGAITVKTETKEEMVKAESLVILDPKLDSGVQEKTEGHDGKGVFAYSTYCVSGKELLTNRDLQEWIDEPVDHVLHLGTSRTGHEGTYVIKGTFTANCSAYWMGNNCRGASGGRCVYGTVAVDRFKYSYGTLFWIEGYGDAVANDCGTSIKGDKLDLWMDSYAESCRWGRRHMTTYILEKR
ncbi:MAG: hypothetical protein KBS63_06745 [Clostridiales bacterium]|nr:hypothetical protein [Candidatus Crickella caballi]